MLPRGGRPVEARHHPHQRRKTSHIKQRAKKRDIRTSFLRTPPVAPALIPQPGNKPSQAVPANTAQSSPNQQPLAVPNMPPPAMLPPAAAAAGAGSVSPYYITPPVTISLGEPCRSSRGTLEPVVGIAAVATQQLLVPESEEVPVEDSGSLSDFTLNFLTTPTAGSVDSSSSSSVSEDDWDTQGPVASLEALDRVLDHLILAPTPAASSTRSSTSSGSSSSSLKKGSKASSSGSSSSSTKKKRPASSSSAAAAPAVLDIWSECDWERELAAAAAHQQLLVVKVEGSRNLMRGGSNVDPTLRFQTGHTRPTPLNTSYLPHADLHSSSSSGSGYGSSYGSYGSPSGSPSGSPASTFGSMNSFDDFSFPIGVGSGLGLSASNGLSAAAMAGISSMGGSSLNAAAPKLDSPVHHWYQQLAGKYAAAAAAAGSNSSSRGAASSSPLRFLSLQSDGPRAKVLCRRLGVSACLSVLVVDPSNGKKLLEVCGTKIEQELPSGLLYFGDADSDGQQPSALLPAVNSRAELEAHMYKTDICVVAYHMHAAPPCIKTYSALYEAAKVHSSTVSFAVMNVDTNAECSDISSELALQRLPTYVVYKGGQEVQRLASTSQRKSLGGVLQQLLAAEAAVEVAAA